MQAAAAASYTRKKYRFLPPSFVTEAKPMKKGRVKPGITE
jgi:hypothetical protein